MVIVIPGNPPRKDDHWVPKVGAKRRPVMVISKDGTAWRKAFRTAMREAMESQPIPTGPLFSVRIIMFVKNNRTLEDGTVMPYRDLDSAISPVFDAMEWAGLVDNDIRIAHLHPPERHKDWHNPRTVVEVKTL